ncbi:hypothetical protein AB0K87_11130 [Streptomyces sp. NPDC053705]|uniref:hypothetical protein n=1 Tax=Streptomyces sp. NPDC053705 TaxID=3156668 RepID=UPI00344931C0
MSTPAEDSGTFLERASEPVDEVVTRRPVIETVGLQPEDLGVLLALLLLPEGWTGTAKSMATMLRTERGWKMSDERFASISKRLRAVGHMGRESVFNEKTKRPEWRLRVYRNPANNPEYVTRGAEEASQVRGGIRETRFSEGSENRESRVSPGQGRNPGNPVFGGESAKTGFPSGDVPAGQGRNPGNPVFGSPPPHPPEEVTTSSPYPQTDTDGSSSLPSQTGEGREFSPKEIHAAESFLQRMATPWNAGKATATKCAPRLLHVMAEQGWPNIFDVDKRILERDITKNPGGITRHSQVLPGRIRDLSLYEVVAPAPRQTPAPQPIEQDRGPISTESITSLLEALQKPSL